MATAAKKEDPGLRDPGNVAAERSVESQGPQSGFIDQMSRKHPSDPVEGSFVTIDRTKVDSKVDENVKDILGDEDGYGVYLEPGELDKDGYPKTIVVRLRDASNARVVVPYDACRAAGEHRRS